jgi:hypothetical protein
LSNIRNLLNNQKKLSSIISTYSTYSVHLDDRTHKEYEVEITLNRVDKTFSLNVGPEESGAGYHYLVNYNFFKELITIYNYENPNDLIPPLHESFTLIGGYRNYHSFNPTVSVARSSAEQQMQTITNQEFGKSLNSNEANEPSIFTLVRLKIAGKHYEFYGERSKGKDCVNLANNQSFLKKINNRLKLIGLEVKIDFTDKKAWGYSFQFFDLKRGRPLNDINNLSAGQKAIIHLVFEAYGRGDLKGGVVLIDEPEIHLHYQFQNEYLKVINEINSEQKCQYILVTHSESLINSFTIHKVKRFALNEDNNTIIKSPILTTEQRFLVKILDNSRSTYAFFARNVILVEGEDDRYFFSEVFKELKPARVQEFAVLDIQGKGLYSVWKTFFEAFGLGVYFIADLDKAFSFYPPIKNPPKLATSQLIADFKGEHPTLKEDIENNYKSGIFVLKEGALENYVGNHNKGLTEIIKFCNGSLSSYLRDSENAFAKEIKGIIEEISKN